MRRIIRQRLSAWPRKTTTCRHSLRMPRWPPDWPRIRQKRPWTRSKCAWRRLIASRRLFRREIKTWAATGSFALRRTLRLKGWRLRCRSDRRKCKCRFLDALLWLLMWLCVFSDVNNEEINAQKQKKDEIRMNMCNNWFNLGRHNFSLVANANSFPLIEKQAEKIGQSVASQDW